MSGNTSVAERLVASQEELGSMELVMRLKRYTKERDDVVSL
jgi:hypothetical protein